MKPSEVVRQNVRRLRKEHDWTAAELAKVTEDLGSPISRGTIASIESGAQRSTTVDQLFVLAVALGVSPGTLITPLEGDTLEITKIAAPSIDVAQEWIVGLNSGPAANRDFYFRHRPIGVPEMPTAWARLVDGRRVVSWQDVPSTWSDLEPQPDKDND